MEQCTWIQLENLFEDYRNGDSKKVRQLFENLQFILIRFCLHKGKQLEAEDLVQQILLKIHVARDDYDRTRVFKSWIFSIAHNHIIDSWRKDKQSQFSHTNESTIDAEMSGKDYDLNRFHDKNEIDILLKILNPLEASLLKLFFIEEFTIKEISEVLQMNESATKVRIHRIISKVRNQNEHN